jgi:type II secretory pathway pseudopilin PulG
MIGTTAVSIDASNNPRGKTAEAGFSLIELLICSLVLLLVTSAAFGILSEIQQTASYQVETQSVINNTRIAMQIVERYIRQAGNDPFASGFHGITIVSATEVQIRSDLTGSAAGNADKGDPDGDWADSGENVTLRFNNKSHSIEIVPNGGPPQIIAGSISDLMFQYYDGSGALTAVDSDVRKISVAISGTSALPNPQTRRFFCIRLCSEVLVMT